MSETSMGGTRRAFEPTLWTVVLRARENSREALEELIRAYWKPLYFFVRRKGLSIEDAKDLVEGFFSELLGRGWLKSVSKEKGKFRTFLLTTLEHYLIDDARRAGAKKRGGGQAPLSLDCMAAEQDYEPATEETPERVFLREWAATALSHALEALSREFDAKTFDAIKPHLTGGPSYAETARTLGIPSSQVNNLIHRARRRYRELLRAEIAGLVDDPALIDEEMKNLLEALKS